MSNRILYFTDKAGISAGYTPIYSAILKIVGIQMQDMQAVSIYSHATDAVKRRQSNSDTLVLNPEARDRVETAIRHYLRLMAPRFCVVSCPAVVGVVTGDVTGTIEKHRGGVYWWDGVMFIVTYPIMAFHRKRDARQSATDAEVQEYKTHNGKWILAADWSKVGRYACGQERKIPDFTYSVVRSMDDLAVAERFLSECVLIAQDIETKVFSESTVTVHGFYGITADGRGHGIIIPMWDAYRTEGTTFMWSESEGVAICEAVARINARDTLRVFHNGGYDCSHYIRDNMPVRGWILDTLHLWHAAYPELKKSLAFVSSILLDNYQYWKDDIKGIDEVKLGRRDSNMEGYWRYGALDCYNTAWNCYFLLQMLQKIPYMESNYISEFRQQLSAIRMSMKGFRADKHRLFEHRERLLAKQEQALADLRVMTDTPNFNPNSPDQVKHILYKTLGAQVRKVKGNVGATDENTLKLSRLEHPLIGMFVDKLWETKKPGKQISDICDVRMRTNRIRTTLSAAGTETWRFNSNGSAFYDGRNLQNITKEMRDWMVADEGYVLFDCDLSQSDAVMIAFESGIDSYIKTMEAIWDGIDSHAVHAEFFFKVAYDRIMQGKKAKDPFIVHPTKGIRNLTKRVVHGGNYQMAATTLFITMGREEVIAAAIARGHANAAGYSDQRLIAVCDEMLKEFTTKLYPGMQDFFARIGHQLATTGKVTEAYGMTRQFLGDLSDPSTQREAVAFLGQGGTAGNINRMMREADWGIIPERFRDGLNPHRNEKPLQISDDDFMFLLQVHDSLVGQVRIEKAKEKLCNLLTIMERPCIINGREFRVKAEAEIGFRWGNSLKVFDPADPHSFDRIVTQSR